MITDFRMARACGLNFWWSLKVALGIISLDEALGEMDSDSESALMEMLGLDDEKVFATGAACNCQGEQACDDCIPF